MREADRERLKGSDELLRYTASTGREVLPSGKRGYFTGNTNFACPAPSGAARV